MNITLMYKIIAHHSLRFWNSISLGAVVAVIIIGMLGSVYGLRRNNLRMVELKNAVLLADEEGDDKLTEASLQELRSHVLAHMNTSLTRTNSLGFTEERPIQLVHKYYRDSIKIKVDLATQTSNESVIIINNAQASCANTPIEQRLECVNQHIADNANQNFPRSGALAKDFYVFNFASPRWSPDLAGFSLVLLGLGIFLLIIRFIVGGIFSMIISHRR